MCRIYLYLEAVQPDPRGREAQEAKLELLVLISDEASLSVVASPYNYCAVLGKVRLCQYGMMVKGIARGKRRRKPDRLSLVDLPQAADVDDVSSS